MNELKGKFYSKVYLHFWICENSFIFNLTLLNYQCRNTNKVALVLVIARKRTTLNTLLQRNPEILFQQHSFAMEAKFRLKFAFIDTHERNHAKICSDATRIMTWAISVSQLLIVFIRRVRKVEFLRNFFSDKIKTYYTCALVRAFRSDINYNILLRSLKCYVYEYYF